MGRRREHDLPHALKEIGRFRAAARLLLQVEQHLLDDQAAEAVTDKSNRAGLETGFAEDIFEDVDGSVLQRHRGSEPIGRRGLIGDRVDRNPLDILRQPERPEGVVVGRSPPGVVGMAAKAVDENDARSRLAAPPGDLDEPRHLDEDRAKRNNFPMKQVNTFSRSYVIKPSPGHASQPPAPVPSI